MTTLPSLSDTPSYLLTTIGASAMHALISAGWVGSRAPGAAVYTRAEPDPLPETGKAARKHRKVTT